MELVNNNKVFFDETSHSYLLDDGSLLIGVTTLMKKHGLSPDYSGIPEAVLRKAAEEGTAIHKEIEDYDNGISVLNTELIDGYRKLGLKHICSEYLVSDNKTVASSIDGVYEGPKPNTVILVDYKTTQKVHTRALEWQLGFYRTLFERQNPDIKVTGCYCLHIDKKTRKILGLVPIDPVTPDMVDEVIDTERKGEIYVDPYQPTSAAIVLSDQELQTYVDRISTIAELKEKLKEYEAFVKNCDSKILAYMLENNLEVMSVSNGTIKLKKGYQRKTVDTAKLAKDYPQLASKYEKITEVSASIIYKSNS